MVQIFAAFGRPLQKPLLLVLKCLANTFVAFSKPAALNGGLGLQHGRIGYAALSVLSSRTMFSVGRLACTPIPSGYDTNDSNQLSVLRLRNAVTRSVGPKSG